MLEITRRIHSSEKIATSYFSLSQPFTKFGKKVKCTLNLAHRSLSGSIGAFIGFVCVPGDLCQDGKSNGIPLGCLFLLPTRFWAVTI